MELSLPLVNTIFAGLQLLVISGGAIIALKNLQKTKDVTGSNFIINAESKIDPLRQGLVNADVKTIRSIYRYAFDVDQLTDEDCAAFPFMQSLYSQASRMFFLLHNNQLDLGLSEKHRCELIELWMCYLGAFRNHPAMKVMHSGARKNQDFHPDFFARAEQVLDSKCNHETGA
jgi:hypothetical protein